MTPDKYQPPEPSELSISVTQEELNATLPPPEMLAPLTEEELKIRQEMIRDSEWAYNDPEVQERYADMIVAVYRRKVVAAGGEWGKVQEEAERLTGVPGNRIAVVVIHGPEWFLTDFSPDFSISFD